MKITAKTMKRGAAVLVLAAALLAAAYHVSYPIKLNLATLPKEIAAFHNRESEDWDPSKIRIYDGVEIGNRVYFLLEAGEELELGRVILERGPLGGYRISRLGYGGGDFLDGIVESGGKRYLLFGGRDISARIARIAVFIEGQSYGLALPKRDGHFLVYTEISGYVEDNHVDRDRVAFYNEAGEDITGLYDLSGGGI